MMKKDMLKTLVAAAMAIGISGCGNVVEQPKPEARDPFEVYNSNGQKVTFEFPKNMPETKSPREKAFSVAAAGSDVDGGAPAPREVGDDAKAKRKRPAVVVGHYTHPKW